MSLVMFVIPFLLLTTAVQRGSSFNIGYVTMPLFEMLAKNLPQNLAETADEYTASDGDENVNQLILAYFDKVKVIDAWKASSLSLDVILGDKTSTVITDARVMYERTTLFTENLVGYNCTRYCYNVSVPTILSVTGWTEERLDGEVNPIVRLRDIHNAIVKAIEERFCCNMTEIAIRLGLDGVSGVQDTAAYFSIWKKFVPHVNEATVKCKADALQVTEAELAELLRTDLATLYSYDLNEMDKYFFPAYEDLLSRKNLFETRSIITGVLATFINWQSGTMARFADIVSQFTPRDLEILYRWQAPQLFAIENIPMSIFETGCGTPSLSDPLFTLSQTLFGFSTNLPDCDVAFLLSRSFNEVDTKYTVSSLSNQNVLEIFRTESQRPSWFDNDIYELLQLNIDEGIWVETPTLNQIAIFSGTTINIFTETSSIPIAIWNIKNFNTSSTLNTIMQTNYISFLTKLLDTYGYTSSGLATAAGITEAQLNTMTIQQAHSLIIDSIEARYRINDLASLLGIAGVNTHVLINLPSFEWDRIVMVAIQNAFAQSADAYSVLLSSGGLQIVTIEGGFPAIQVANSVTYHTDRVTPTELASCINRTLSGIYAMSFAEYHELHINSIVPLLRNKITFETQTMEFLLNSFGLDFDNEKSKSVAEVITRLTGLTTANLQCMFGWSSTFLTTDLAMTFQTANETRLCNDFLGRTMFDIVTIISQTANKVCFLCTIDPCGVNTMCKDIPNSFQCTCNAGYTGNAIEGCVDIPECLLTDRNDCHENATCNELPGSFDCTCNDGFVGDGRICLDINECTIDPNRCGANGVCHNTIGSFYCDCESGWRWNGATCEDINECEENTDNCHAFAVCTNTIGSFTCHCPNGLTGDGLLCEDILECNFQAGLFPCHARADCTETIGSFICQCQDGYTGDGQICTDINECNENTDDCHVNADCFNTVPGFVCNCHDGFQGDGRICNDVDECQMNLDNCHENANCLNNIGSFQCDCKDGFNGNGTHCYVAEVSFTRELVAVNEGDDEVITFMLNGEIDEIAVVNIAVSGTATEGTDYVTFTKAFFFNPGDASTKRFTIDTTDDERLEELETIILTLTSLHSHVTPGDIPSMTVTIIDNDAVGVGFSQQAYTANEVNAGFANVVVEISSGIVEKEITVSFSTAPGTAVINGDFTTHTQQVIFAPGNTASKVVRVPLVNDGRIEEDEQFSVLLSTTDADVNIVNSPATVTIVDDDVATVRFEDATYTVGENDTALTVRLLVTGVRDIDLTARLNTVNVGANAGNDYTSLVNRDISIPRLSNTVFTTILISEDSIVENDETFSVTLSSQSLPHLITTSPAAAVVTIQDNDVVAVQFSQSTYQTQEDTTQVNVRITVTGSFEKSLQLSLSTSDGSATSANNDYLQYTGTITFNPGDPESRDVPIQILEDNLVENTESLVVELSTTDADIVFPSGRTATINILDDDVATAFIQNAEYTFVENTVTTNIPISLQGNLAIPVTVRLSTSPGTATWPSDFTAISNHEIEFRPGEASIQQLALNIEDDEVVESTEMFSVILSTGDNKVTIGQFGTTTVRIVDNDQIQVHFSSSHYEADEESGFAFIGLVLVHVLETTSRVRITPSNGTATEPQDFPLLNYDVTLTAGQPRTEYYRINITNDMLEEYTEHFYVLLTAIDANAEIVEPRLANISIGESDDIFFCDPNARRYPCHIKADCRDVPGSFTCTCVTGYSGDGLSCTNINECDTITCPFNATCQDNPGSYTCICKAGFRGDGVNCVDINECAEDTDNCHAQATCQNTLGGYECLCNEGWSGDGTSCSNINECQQVNDCHDNADCFDTEGSYNCQCKDGFTGDGRQCVDVDECTEGTHDCHAQATCQNNLGGFGCQCNIGWSGDGTSCADINECDQVNDCHDDADCFNTDGSYTCQCKNGFSGDGNQCVDIDECDTNTDNCPDNSVCSNTHGSFDCTCNPGFIHRNSICDDVDECDDGSHNCHADAYCVNMPGTFECNCNVGFTGNGTFCTNLNECALVPTPCDESANCQDTHGSFNCTCWPGFTGNGTHCEDIIDCILLPKQYPCDIRATCRDVPGGFTCTCPTGFVLNGDNKNCDDVNECEAMTYSCHANASCVNIPGSYDCQCNENFVGDGKISCVDTTCSTGNPCSPDAYCSVNITTSSYHCVCHQGFTGDGITCNEIDECLISGSCGSNANCVNLPRGSHTCTCQSGYTGDPNVNCFDVDECDNYPCHVNATCSNSPGTFSCACNAGFSGDGTNVCNDINECDVAGTCNANADCTNTVGGHYCTCHQGYTGDGKVCSEIQICGTPQEDCSTFATCANTGPATYTCTCQVGYTGDGKVCNDINECDDDPCEEDGAVCANTPGSYTCSCPEDLYNNGNLCYVFCPFKLDLAFIVDTSDSISEDDFAKVKEFMTETIGRMEIGENGNHIAAISFGNTADVFMRFNTITGAALTRSNLKNQFASFPKDGGLTRIDLALYHADTDVFTEASGMRTASDIRKVAVVLTDGEQTMGPGVPIEPLSHYARRLQSRDITVLAIGIGASVPRDQLLNLTNSIEENILEVNSFENLLSIINQFVNISCTDIDECDLYDNVCHENANCKDTLGAYSCLCNAGYEGDGFDCEDINECDGQNECDQNSNCTNTVGSYVCTCKDGYSGNGRVCQDIDECDLNMHGCHENADCSNTEGSYTCACSAGYTGDGKISCTDIDECDLNTDDCHERADCTNTEGSYTCVCLAGYTGDGKISCTDIDECDTGNHNCHGQAECRNSDASYTCTCNPGYTGDGRNCQDIDECAENTDECHDNAECSNNVGSYTCTCPIGYSGDGRTSCEDIDECDTGSHTCHAQAECRNTGGSYTCTCNPGYTGGGSNCQDIDECDLNTDVCHEKADCTNTEGSYTCVCSAGYTGDGKSSCTASGCSITCISTAECRQVGSGFECVCKTGYTGDGTSCTDIDECAENTDECHDNAECSNNVGSYTCACRIGYSGDGRTSCEDIDECDTGSHTCHAQAECRNTGGSYTCTCNPGYTGDGSDCQDIDECDSNTDGCHERADCTNTEGSYTCVCSAGYTGDGKSSCIASGCSDTCISTAECRQVGSGFECVCKTGYTGDGTSCIDIDECAVNTHNCHAQATCQNNPGGFECQCNEGWSGDGTNCADINECNGDNVCDANADCMDTPGSYTCQCKNGYTGNGTTCLDIRCGSICSSNADCREDEQGQNFNCVCRDGYSGDGTSCSDVDECSQSPCGDDQACRNYPGTYDCYCTSPGKYLNKTSKTCIDVSSVSLQIRILEEFQDALASQNSLEFYEFATRLQDLLNDVFRAIYGSNYIDSVIVNLSNGSVVADIILIFKPGKVPSASNLQQSFINNLDTTNDKMMLGEFVIAGSFSQVKDYDECDPMLTEHSADCPENSYCADTYGSYSCQCSKGYEKHIDHDICVGEDDDWWIIYAVVFGAVGFVVITIIILFCFLEVKRNEELYTLHGDARPHDKRIDEEVAPGFPGSVPRTASSTSQLLLTSERTQAGTEKLAMYEVNPIYDSANG